MICCKICNKEFTLIHWSHLASHEMTTAEYRSLYGEDSLVSAEYREMRSKMSSGKNNSNFGKKWTDEMKKASSKKLTGRAPWNKSKRWDGPRTEKQSNSIVAREKKYNIGELTRYVPIHSLETKGKISNSIKGYAATHRAEMKARAAKSVRTKQEADYDFAIFRGRTHSKETKKLLSDISIERNKKKTATSVDMAIARAKEFDMTVLDISNNIALIECDVCGEHFEYTRQYLFESKIHPKMCRSCHPIDTQASQLEIEIRDFILSMLSTPEKYLINDRTVLSRKELDIFLPERMLAFEINGLYWHSELVLENNGYDRKKDYQKYLECKEKGIKLITIHEDEWRERTDIAKSRITGFLNKNSVLYARKTDVVELTSKEANQFLKRNHLQGTGRSNVRLGLKYNGELVAVMTLSKENVSRKSTNWEINRFCNKLNHTIVGGASKLFSYFIRLHSPENVISFSDNRWGDGTLYQSLGFTMEHCSPPSYWYFRPNEGRKYHRYSLRKTPDDNQVLTEWDNRKLQGWNRIWDCGHSKWVWNR